MPGAPPPRMGGGVPQMPTSGFNMAAPDWAGLVEQQQGPLAQVIKGFQNYQQQQQATKLFGAQLDQLKSQTAHDNAMSGVETAQMQGYQQTQALQLYNQFGTIGVKTPGVTNTPQYRARMEQLAQAAGMPSPFGPDGKFNGDQFKQQMTPALMKQLRDMQPGPMRDALGDTVTGYTDAMRTEPADYSGSERAAIIRAQDLGIHYQNADNVAQQRATIDDLNYRLRAELNPEKKAELQAQINHYNAESTNSYATAQRNLAQASMISQEIQAGLPQLRALAMSYRLNPGAGKALTTAYTRLTGQAGRLKAAMDGAQAAYEQAQMNGLSGSTLQPFASKLSQTRAAYQSTMGMLHNTYSQLQSLVGPSSGLRVGMGAKSVQVGGPLTLPPPPDATLGGDTPQGGDARGFINPNNIPSGFLRAQDDNGNTYYKDPKSGAIYDSNGDAVPNNTNSP